MQLSSCEHNEESHNLRVWLDYITLYPWNVKRNIERPTSLIEIQKEIAILKANVNREIYGMDAAKEEMLRYYLDFRMGNKSMYTIALAGPPGVGKTIFFQVFAKYINMPFRIVQGGCITDVSYIQGGHKMYIGSSAGCITDAIQDAKCEDVMVILDELEKIYDNVNPLAIMNQINHMVDRSSNHMFTDHYVGSSLPVDYSKILFAATLNDKTRLSDVTDNRLCLIELNGYSIKEKIEIAKNYVLPKMIKESIFKDNILTIDDNTLQYIIEKKIEHEPGIRKLQNVFKQIISKMQFTYISALKSDKVGMEMYTITNKMIDEILK
jgi:ATP-dependent Lon protease